MKLHKSKSDMSRRHNKEIADFLKAEEEKVKHGMLRGWEGFGSTIIGGMVKVHVGPKQKYIDDRRKVFNFEKKMLCARVPYFNEIFNDPSKGFPNYETMLPGIDPTVFEVLAHWIHTDKIKVDGGAENFFKTVKGHELYILGYEMKLPRFLDAVLSLSIETFRKNDMFSSSDMAFAIYGDHRNDCYLKTYFAQEMAYIKYGLPSGDSSSHDPIAVYESIMRVLWRLEVAYDGWVKKYRGRLSEIPDPRRFPPCYFHHHAKDQPCHVRTLAEIAEDEASS